MKKLVIANLFLTAVVAALLIAYPAKAAFQCPPAVIPAGNYEEGDLFPCPADPAHFYMMSNGVAVHIECPPGLFFNPLLNICDWPN